MSVSIDVTLKNFDSVSSTLEVKLQLTGGSLSGTFTKLEDTLGDPGFPDSGPYRGDEGGIDLLFGKGDGPKELVLCQLVGMFPGKTTAPEGLVANFGEPLLKYTVANWTQ